MKAEPVSANSFERGAEPNDKKAPGSGRKCDEKPPADPQTPAETQSFGHVSGTAQRPLRKPPWIRVKLPSGESFTHLKELIRSKSLHTVCEEAHCPNMAECWGCGTATFMILGDTCTRNCRFCAVKHGSIERNGREHEEPLRVARAVADMKLRHAVITSVTRDDLPDGGASFFAEAIRQIRRHNPGCTVEVLIPDFRGSQEALATVLEASPEILGHNMETVPRLYPLVRPRARYDRSLRVLRAAKEMSPAVATKSGIMVGMGETVQEIFQVMRDMGEAKCDILTIGQYLSPSRAHFAVVRYYTPEEFTHLRQAGLEAGLRHVEAGPLVRSSYHAETQANRAASSRTARI